MAAIASPASIGNRDDLSEEFVNGEDKTTITRAVAVARADYASEARALCARNFPHVASAFSFEEISSADGKDVFELEDGGSGKIVVRGNTAVAMAQGLGWYMRYYAHTQLSWNGDQILNAGSVTDLPPVGAAVRRVATSKYSYYMNTCTHSYTAAWFSWARWQREVDWMALNGVNLPLSFTGQEFVWRALFREMGITDAEMADWFAGPAFLAWFRMGNVQGWGGPMPAGWIDQQHKLQLQILERERALGMTPVLPMFSGYVPKALKTHYPDAKITEMYDWARFNETYRTWNLEVTDPLFATIGKRFIELQTKIYGTNHIFNADTYNEMIPPSGDLGYLRNSSRGVYEAMTAADPNGIWLMQGWLFVNDPSFWTLERTKAYLSGVPDKSMIVLDLFTEYKPVWSKTDSYFGKPWIWCMLHNFGGTPGLWGNLSHILGQPHLDRAASSSFVGVGLTMEATQQNYIVYEALLEARWRDAKPDPAQWVQDFALRRYGDAVSSLEAVQQAWATLHTVVYSAPTHNVSYIELRPSFPTTNEPRTVISLGRRGDRVVHRKVKSGTLEDLWHAWGLLISPEVVAKLSDIETYNHDLAILGREILMNLFDMARADLLAAYNSKDLAKLTTIGARMLSLIDDMDTLLKTDKDLLLGKWIADARAVGAAWGATVQELDLLEFNARNQLTLWGPDGNINDYAKKSWSGLYSGYYRPRWSLFIEAVKAAVAAGKQFSPDQFNADCLAWEKQWQNGRETYPAVPTGSASSISTTLYAKWRQQ